MLKMTIMKYRMNKLTAGVIGLLIVTVSCSDQFLKDKKDYNNMTTIDVYSDPDQAKAVFATIYKQILERYNSPLHGSDPLMRQGQTTGGRQWMYTEELVEPDFKDNRHDGQNVKQSKAGNHIANPPYWNDPRNNASNFNNFSRYTLFPTIYLINNYIEEIDRSRGLYVNDRFWDCLKGQAIFARAWLYFDAVRLWGGFPYYCTESDQPADGDRSGRMPVQDCLDKVCADFETAAGLLPEKWDNENYGRFTSVAALAMASRVRVYMASPVFNASWDNPGGKRWKAALDASFKALQAADQAGYGTSVTDINSWDRAFYAYDGVFNPEAIITIQMSNDPLTKSVYNTWESSIRPGVVAQTSGAGEVVPEEQLLAFPMKNGKPATAANGYDDEKFYRDRDPRFYRTFAISGCEWPSPEKKQIWLYAWRYSNKDGNMYRYSDGSQGDNGAIGKSRALVWKMANPAIAAGSESTSGTDILEYRYAELLLNVAECYAAMGDAGNCLQYIGRVRSRVGIPSADNYGLGGITDRYRLIKAVLNERQVELAYEGKRSWDMRRWLLYEGGAGFDPRIGGGFDDATRAYDPEGAYGTGWRIYDGKNGRPDYTRADNVLTRLGIPRFSGTKHHTKVWGYALDTVHEVSESGYNHPLADNALLKAVPHITRDMTESARNAAFDRLEALCEGAGIRTYDPISKMGPKYGVESSNNVRDQNFLFAWRGWYYIYPIHYDMYDAAKGNSWITQTAGWMTNNANPAGNNVEEQDGTYFYCMPE